jgi:hypothetical protein
VTEVLSSSLSHWLAQERCHPTSDVHASKLPHQGIPAFSLTPVPCHVTQAQLPDITYSTSTTMETITLPHLPDSPIQACLFKNVQNAAFLRQQLLEGNTDFEYAFLDASVLISRSHVLAACFRAICDSLNGCLKSRNVHSEIVFSLSPNNNVSCLHS